MRRVNHSTTMRRGFTITEVLVTVLILAVSMTAIAVSLISSLRISNQNKERSKALSFARMTMEELYTQSYYSTNLNVGRKVIRNPGYAGFYEVTLTTNDTKRIYVKVYWDDFNNFQANTNLKASVEMYGTISDALH
ncbi:MAG: prepilin-type N-terminal cleavage/methylation domain-containing protein [Kiritimatiellia bacterium]|jgi:prepilin-type N-terminal cleavage/methylation domain-containing protein